MEMTYEAMFNYIQEGARELDRAVHKICRSHGSGGFSDINAPPVKIVKNGRSWRVKSNNRTSRINLCFAFFPTRCRICDRFIWFNLFYGIPDMIRLKQGMGPFHNEHHCTSCHKEDIKKKGNCTFCHEIWQD